MASTGPKTVTLVDPNGGECLVSHPAEVNNLVYGAGYKVKGGKTPEEAIAALADNAVTADAAPQEGKTASK